ncbi:uncharacterized protein [Misgurnus anguillicaudatus]|uniref:uncharacterized protein n=1 Tax=Misgurnus anguillicaudatus TaxID=75329 RepID=UPI003CCF56F3
MRPCYLQRHFKPIDIQTDHYIENQPCFKPGSVFGVEVKSVSVMEGDSVTLHTDTKLQKDDLILWSFKTQGALIAKINKDTNKISIYDDVLDGRFIDRLQVNNQTGDLTITNITSKHTGLYQININAKQKISYRFNVTLARPPVPVISRDCTKNSLSVSKCVVLCSVLNVRDVSLSWYKGNSLLSIISVSDLNIRLSLSLEVEYQDTNTYRCVLNNTITNQTQHLNITQLCQMCPDTTVLTFILICCVFDGSLMIVTSVLIFWIYRELRNIQQHVQTREEEITYANTTFFKRAANEPGSEDDVVYAGVNR